jgi:hypothetical protein
MITRRSKVDDFGIMTDGNADAEGGNIFVMVDTLYVNCL